MADPIDSLPTDKTQPNVAEMQILDTLFKESPANTTEVFKFMEHSKDVLLVGLLFALMSLPYVDPLITKFFPATATSPFFLIGAKSILMMASYFIVKNFYLVRKS